MAVTNNAMTMPRKATPQQHRRLTQAQKAPHSEKKRHLCLLSLLIIVIFSLWSCGPSSGYFRIEGRFRNFNQGTFYVYSPDGKTNKLDTVKVSDGRFSYEVELEGKATYILLFPNFSEQVVFGESGATAKVSGDASHLKEMEVTGTDENELMAKFRQNANRLTPPEATDAAAEFVNEHPESIVSIYLLKRYFLQTTNPNYTKASQLLATMLKATPDNARLAKLKRQVDKLKASDKGSQMQDFSATDIYGKKISKKEITAKVSVVNAWASWNYDSQKMQRQLDKLKKEHHTDMAVLGICLDAATADCKQRVENDSLKWPNVCDGLMWDSPLLKLFGIGTVPGNVVFDSKGRVVARNLDTQKMEEKVNDLLKK